MSGSPFAVRSSADGIFTAGINGATSGRDTVAIPASVAGTPQFTIYNDWSGRLTVTKRTPSASFLLSTPTCAAAVSFIDVNVSSTRRRDGYALVEAVSFGYDAQYKPICALVSDGRYWIWNASEPLPVSAFAKGSLTGVQFSGAVSRTAESTDLDSTLTGNVSLDPDTETSAFLNFSYFVTPFSTAPSYRAFGSNARFQLRISTTGALLGFAYIRTGYLPEPTGALVLTTLSLGVN